MSFFTLGIARLSPDPNQHSKDLEKILHRFANIKLQYESVLFDSRLIILSKSKPDLTAKQNFIFLEDSDPGTGEEFSNFMIDFMSSIFVVLESKRIEKMNEKLEKMDLPTAPIEHEQVISESDTRLVRICSIFMNFLQLSTFFSVSLILPATVVFFKRVTF